MSSLSVEISSASEYIIFFFVGLSLDFGYLFDVALLFELIHRSRHVKVKLRLNGLVRESRLSLCDIEHTARPFGQ